MIIHPSQYMEGLALGTCVAAVWFACALSAYGNPLNTDERESQQAEVSVETNRFSVIDGDTLIIDGMRVRLHGIDAPEIAQQCGDGQGGLWSCGLKAKHFLEIILTGSSLDCDVVAEDRYERKIAKCEYGAGHDVAHVMVKQGYALDWPRYSAGAYADEQDEARRYKRGIWTGEFVEPWEYRRTAG